MYFWAYMTTFVECTSYVHMFISNLLLSLIMCFRKKCVVEGQTWDCKLLQIVFKGRSILEIPLKLRQFYKAPQTSVTSHQSPRTHRTQISVFSRKDATQLVSDNILDCQHQQFIRRYPTKLTICSVEYLIGKLLTINLLKIEETLNTFCNARITIIWHLLYWASWRKKSLQTSIFGLN